MRTDSPAGFQAVHPGHHHVEQDHVGPAGFDELHRLVTTTGEHQLVALPLEHRGHRLQTQRFVVDDQEHRLGRLIEGWIFSPVGLSLAYYACVHVSLAFRGTDIVIRKIPTRYCKPRLRDTQGSSALEETS